jgi:hypothetical protein
MVALNFPTSPSIGQTYSANGKTFVWNGESWLGSNSGFVGSRGDTGFTGSIGFTGSQGAGFTGSAGTNGFTGSQGIQGIIGYTGSQGLQGVQGIIGYTGSQGDTGFTGSVGFTGSKGDIGFTGSQGSQGVIGYTGSQGIQGVIGYTGSVGFTGSKGDTGLTGSVGFTGSKGDIGFTGSRGADGQIVWSRKTANYTAVNQDGIIADTSGGVFVITLPATPSLGDYVVIVDGGDWVTNNLTVAKNGSTIEGFASDLVLDVSDTRVDLVYDGTTWQVFSNVGQKGFTGSQGIIGFTGSQGVIGFTGSQGEGADVTITDDTTTNATRYVSFVTATSGSASGLGVSSTKLYFNPSTGQLNATEFNSLSDETMKTDIRIVENALDVINMIDGFKFKWKDTEKESLGVSAQKLETVLPELVSNGDYKTVNYNGLIAVLIEAIKELNGKIK